MKIWNPPKKFSPEFLDQYHELVVYDVFHRIKVFLLFPHDCACETNCRCEEWRKKAILALNTNLYNKARQQGEKLSRLKAMKELWRMPEAHLFQGLYANSYPIWAIEKELKAREENDHFNVLDQLVWTFLRLGKTTTAYLGTPEVSVNEVFHILKKPPSGATKEQLKEDERRCGKKKYEDLWKQYQYVCHFIAALALWEKEVTGGKRLFSDPYPSLEQIKRFLSLAHWFRQKLLALKRPNVKESVFLLEENLCPLPPWVQSEGIDFPIDPDQEKIREVFANAVRIDPREQFLLKQARKAASLES